MLEGALAIAWKDLRAEARSKEILSAMLVFALLAILLFSFALELDRTRRIALLREREAEALHGLESRRRASSDEFSGAPAPLLRASAGQLLAYGDSWFHYVSLAPPDPNNPSRATNIAAVLKTQGYSFPVSPLGNSGISLEQMAAPRNRKLLRDALEELFQTKQPPMAILLSGGGNDVVRDRLMRLLKSAPQQTPLDADEVQAFIDGKLHGHYFDILNDIKTVCDAYKQKVRVLLHAYDHPIPDGRFLFGSEKNPLSWLYPSITRRGYNVTEGTKIMRCLIDHLHAMQNVLAGEFLNVRHVPVAGTSDPFASNYKEFWENELHPTPMGFGLVARKFVDVLNGP